MGIAADTFGTITREQYANWEKNYLPLQKELLATTTNADLMNTQLGKVDANVDSAFNAAQTSNSNMMGRYGLADSTGGSNTNAAQLALSKVTSKNSIRDYEADRSMATLSGANLSALTPQGID